MSAIVRATRITRSWPRDAEADAVVGRMRASCAAAVRRQCRRSSSGRHLARCSVRPCPPAARPAARGPPSRARACSLRALAPGRPRISSSRVGGSTRDDHVDAVQQRPAQLRRVAARRAPGGQRHARRASPAVAARARIRGGHQHEPRREARRVRCARVIAHAALLERLAQRLQRGPRELGELVEEQHAVLRRGSPRPGSAPTRRRPARRSRSSGAARGTGAARRAARRRAGRRRCARASPRAPPSIVSGGMIDGSAPRQPSTCRSPAGPSSAGCGRPRPRPPARA